MSALALAVVLTNNEYCMAFWTSCHDSRGLILHQLVSHTDAHSGLSVYLYRNLEVACSMWCMYLTYAASDPETLVYVCILC